MPSEHLTVVHNKFVNGICNLFVGISSTKQSFDIKETCLEGMASATIPCESELVHFDILLIQRTGNRRIHYCVECKTRKECSSSTSSDLKRHLKIFLQKAYKTIDSLQFRYGENYGFMFISDVPFGVWDNHITFSYIQKALDNETSPNSDKISELTSKVKIMVFSDWFADLFKEE